MAQAAETKTEQFDLGYQMGCHAGVAAERERCAKIADAANEITSAPTQVVDRETVQVLLDLLNPLHGSLDEQTYDEKVKENFDAPRDAEYNVNVTARMESNLTQAVCILENRLKQFV